jgi:hypothetical protein
MTTSIPASQSPASRGRAQLIGVACVVVLVALVVWHNGPGQVLEQRGAAQEALDEAAVARAASRHSQAASLLHQALEALHPDDDAETRFRIRLALGRALLASPEGLIAGSEVLHGLSEESRDREDLPQALKDDIRAASGEAAYFTAWRLRLAGAGRSEWLPEAQMARQQFRLLARDSEARNNPTAGRAYTEVLDQVIQLQLMGDEALAALPLPSNCGNCSSISTRRQEQRRSRNNNQRQQERQEQQQEQQEKEEKREKKLRQGLQAGEGDHHETGH